MSSASLRAQAKLNLYLRVTGRDAAGYHHLDTLFCRVTLADEVTLTLERSSRALDCSGPALPAAGLGPVVQNLAWRAAVAYSAAAHWPAGFSVHVEKHIPAGAGLGGGSADAGAVLRLFDALNPRPLGAARLFELGRALGADVPFLTRDDTPLAHALGRGDECTPLEPLAARPCLLALPDTPVPTADAYRWLDAARGWDGPVATTPPPPLRAPLDWTRVHALAANDFESVVFPRVPAVARAWEYLRSVAEGGSPPAIVRMSGSGSACFLLGAGEVPGDQPPPAGVRTLQTRTAARVEAVRRLD